MFSFLGFLNAALIPVSGFAATKPQLAAKSIISFKRCTNRFTVSRLPFASIGVFDDRLGKMCRSSERHISTV